MPGFRSLLVYLQAIALLAWLSASSGCHQRMLRATPFGTSEAGVVEGNPESRIALWPLLYHRPPVTSVLWPLVEVTDTSWAVRPLIASYEEQLDLIWPLLHVNQGEGSGYLFPLLFVDTSEDHPGFLSPVAGVKWEGENLDWFYSPLYSRSSRAHVLPPMLTAFSRGEGDSWLYSPLYIRRRETEGPRLDLFPFLLTGWGRKSDDESWFLTPLLYRGRDPGKAVTVVPPALSWWTEFDDGWSARALVFLAGAKRRADESGEFLFPLYFRGRSGADAENSHFALLPFYWKQEKPGWRFTSLPFLLSARTRDAKGGGSWHLLLSAIAWGRSFDEDGKLRSRFHRVYPFYGTTWRADGGGSFSLPFLLHEYEWWPDSRWSHRFLFHLVEFADGPARASSRILPFYSYSHQKRFDVPDESGNPVEVEGDEREFQLLGYLYDWKYRLQEDGGEYRRHRVLWRLWYDESLAGRRSMDVFPFITFDRDDATQSLSWSWLYKFIRYERTGSKKKLTLFFLPLFHWGEPDG